MKSKRKITLKGIRRTAAAIAAASALFWAGARTDFQNREIHTLTKQGVEEPETGVQVKTPTFFFWKGKFNLTPDKIKAMNEITKISEDIFGKEKRAEGIVRILRTIKLNKREITEDGINSLIQRHSKAIEENPGMWPSEREQRDNIIKVFEAIQELPPQVRQTVMEIAGVKFYKE